jgi:hypothetical protein
LTIETKESGYSPGHFSNKLVILYYLPFPRSNRQTCLPARDNLLARMPPP